MKIYATVTLFLILMVAGCASIKDMQKTWKFEDTSGIYGDAVRWSDFNTAQTFIEVAQGNIKSLYITVFGDVDEKNLTMGEQEQYKFWLSARS